MERVRQIVGQHCELPSSEDQDLALDSVALVRLVEDLESSFGLIVRPADVLPENFRTLRAIERFVSRAR